MAEFQEEQLFRGAAQGQGFATTQAPDITPFLRENMEIADRNYARMVSVKKADQESQVLKTQELYKALGVFSSQALEVASTIGKAYIDSQVIEGKNKMRSYGQAQNYGVSVQGQQEYDATKQNIQQNTVKLNEDANKLSKQGAPLEAVNYIKSLGAYEQIGAIEYYLTQKGAEYKTAKDEFMSSTTHVLRDADDKEFTPSQIDDNPVRHAIATREFGLFYLANNVGIGKDFNPNNAVMHLLYKPMDDVDSADMTVVRNRKAYNDAQIILKNAEEAFAVNKDLNLLISVANGLPDEKNIRRSNAGALEYAFGHLLDLYRQNQTPEKKLEIRRLLAATKVSASIDSKQRSFAEFYAPRAKALEDGMLQLDVRKNQEKKFEQSLIKDQLDVQLSNFIQNEWDGTPDSLKVAVMEMNKVANKNGIFDYRGDVASPYLAEATEKQNRDTWIQLLTQAEKNRTLSTSDLTNSAIPADVRKAFMGRAAEQDDIRARTPSEEDTEKDLKTALKTALGDASLDANYLGLNAATFTAMRIYRQKVAQNYAALGAEGAHDKAVQETTAMILKGEGMFTRADWKDRKAGEAPVTYWPRFTPTTTIKQGKTYNKENVKQAYQKDNSIIDRIPLVPVPTLENVAAQIRAGAPVDMPGIYRELGGNPTELLNRNLAAINRNERMIATPADVIATKTSSPSVRRLAQKAQTLFDQQRVYAAETGAVTDPKLMNPAVINYRNNPNQTVNPTSKTLTYSGNKAAYKAVGTALQGLGFRVAEHPDFGGVVPGVHSAKGYHPHGEAFDVTHHIGSYENSVAKTRQLKEKIRAMGLFREIIGPGDGDSRHTDHLHLGGLVRPITKKDIETLTKIFRGAR
jgi:hypothetical protein